MQRDLPKKTLGRTGLEVTQLGFGAMELRGTREEITEDQAEQVLNGVLDAGINFIDTAPDYGLSEERIGKYISQRRDEFYLATKCGCNITVDGARQEPRHVWTAERLRRNIEQSLERMKTDRVDLLQMHNPTVEEVEKGGLVEVLQEIQKAGKTRFIGVSSTAPDLVAFARMGVFDTFQIPYSALERRHEEMIGEAAELGAGILIRGGVAKGHLAGSDRWDKFDQAELEQLAEGMNRYEFVLRFTLTHPGCHTTIVGTADLDHLKANAATALAGPLSDETYGQAKERLAKLGETPEK
jgi:aryl-alcohol dehydrogenase-like predicted oxidoreductase